MSDPITAINKPKTEGLVDSVEGGELFLKFTTADDLISALELRTLGPSVIFHDQALPRSDPAGL